jgi:hypothetical protein
LNTETLSPNSENTRISSSFAPNATYVILVVPDVGCAMLAEKEGLSGEKTRMCSWELRRRRWEEGDQRKLVIWAVSSGGRGMTRVVSRERVVRRVSLEGRRVAMNAPSGLGRDCVDAGYRELLVR